MAEFSFTPSALSIKLKFVCSGCKNLIETDELFVPSPNYSAETHHESVESEDYECECSHCNKKFDISLHNGFYGGYGEIFDLPRQMLNSVEEEFEPYDPEWEYEFVEEHVRDIVKVLDKIEVLDEFTKKILYRNLYANLIAIMEAYLSETLIQQVLISQETKRKFVENYKGYRDMTSPFSNLFKNLDNLNSIIISTLRELMYHNLGKIKPIYGATIGVDLGDVSELMKAVVIRHDIVHRNGKDINGYEPIITKDIVYKLAYKISDFINNIENQIHQINFDEDSPLDLSFDNLSSLK